MSKKAKEVEDLLKDLLGEEEEQVQEEQPKQQEQPTTTTANQQAWYRIGKDAEEFARSRALAFQQRKERAVPIFYLKVEEEATVVFVDDKGFGVNVHKVKVGDRWISLTCVKDFAPCPLCATGNRSSYVIYYTVIDTRPFTDREGRTSKFRKSLFAATGSTLQMRIADEKEEQNGLIGAVCVFKRYSAKESSAGTLVKFKGKIDIAQKFGEEYAKPLDYLKILAPPTEEELESLGFSVSIVGGDDILGDFDI